MKELRIGRVPSAASRYRQTSSRLSQRRDRSDTGQQNLSWTALGPGRSGQPELSAATSLDSLSEIQDGCSGSASELQQSLERESVHRERAEEELSRVKNQLVSTEEELSKAQQTLTVLQARSEVLESDLEKEKSEHDKVKSDVERLKVQAEELGERLLQKEHTNQTLRAELRKLAAEKKRFEDLAKTAQGEKSWLSKQERCLSKKVQGLEEKISKLKEELDLTRRQNVLLTKEMDTTRKNIDATSRILSETNREKDALKKKLCRLSGETRSKASVWRTKETELEAKICVSEHDRRTAEDNKKALEHALTLRDKERERVANAGNQMKKLESELRDRDNDVREHDKKLVETQKKLSDMISKNKELIRDKEKLERQLREHKEILNQMSLQSRVTMQQEELTVNANKKLESELVNRERESRTARLSQAQANEEMERLKAEAEIQRIKLVESQIAKERLEKQSQYAQNSLGLRHAQELSQAHREKELAMCCLSSKTEECTSLGTKLKEACIRADRAELALENKNTEKIKYHRECEMLRRQSAALARRAGATEDLRRELFRVHAELLREQGKSQALEEELASPLNIHRWRLLQGSDPHRQELVEKVLLLQKLVVSRNVSSNMTQLELEEKDMMLDKVRQRLDTLSKLVSDPDSSRRQLQDCQKELGQKKDQIKSITSELNMYTSIYTAYEQEITRLSQELQEARTKLQKEETISKMKIKSLKERLKEPQQENCQEQEECLRVRPATTGMRRRLNN